MFPRADIHPIVFEEIYIKDKDSLNSVKIFLEIFLNIFLKYIRKTTSDLNISNGVDYPKNNGFG